MNAEQVLTANRQGVEIASHTVNHVGLTRQAGPHRWGRIRVSGGETLGEFAASVLSAS
jgi:hypothetical protein